MRPSPKGCREAERPEQSDGDSENCIFFMFMKQSICRDNPSALHNSVLARTQVQLALDLFAHCHIKIPEAHPQGDTAESNHLYSRSYPAPRRRKDARNRPSFAVELQPFRAH